MATEANEVRDKIAEEIHEACGRYLDTYEDFEGCYIAAVYTVCEVVTATGRTLLEISDPQSSRFTSMGMLFAALHDPRWLDPGR